jgi:hypothetical protein
MKKSVSQKMSSSFHQARVHRALLLQLQKYIIKPNRTFPAYNNCHYILNVEDFMSQWQNKLKIKNSGLKVIRREDELQKIL